jgi:hypothetical protein
MQMLMHGTSMLMIVPAFVLQLEGTKRWRIYEPLVQLPREHSGDLSRGTYCYNPSGFDGDAHVVWRCGWWHAPLNRVSVDISEICVRPLI